MDKKFIDLKKAALFLELSEDELKEKVEQGEITAYKIGGAFLRFDFAQLEEIKKKLVKQTETIKESRENELKSEPIYREPRNLEPARFKPSLHEPIVNEPISFRERLIDYFHFNDFYIFSLLVSFLILWVIFITNQK